MAVDDSCYEIKSCIRNIRIIEASIIALHCPGTYNRLINCSQMKQAVLAVTGMSCGACTSAITKAVTKLAGVKTCEVSLVTGECQVLFDESLCSGVQITDTVENCGFDACLTKEQEVSGFDMNRTVFSVKGMSCGACVSAVTTVCEKLAGVADVSVSLITEECIVDHDITKVTCDRLKDVIEDSGFECHLMRTDSYKDSFGDDGSGGMEKNLKNITFDILNQPESDYHVSTLIENTPGIISFKHLNSRTLNIQYDTDLIGIRKVYHLLKNNGLEVAYSNALDSSTQLQILSKSSEIKLWKSNSAKACCIAVLMMTLYMIIPLAMPPLIEKQIFPYQPLGGKLRGLYYRDIIGLILSTYVQFCLGKVFYTSTWASLKHGSGTMETLVCVSTTCAYSFSVYSIFHNMVHPSSLGLLPRVVFDTSVMLIAFISFGKLLENKAKSQTSSALAKLISLTPSSCYIAVYKDDHMSSIKEIGELNIAERLEVPLFLLQAGDIVEVSPGEKIPADGIILEGETEIDESLMTGESMFAYRAKGDQVIGGSINGPGHFYFKTINVGDDTRLAHIIKVMKRAQFTKAPIQGYADTLAAIFVPIIIFLAIITFVLWEILCSKWKNLPNVFPIERDDRFFFCLQIATSVLVVACPCALGLATPTAIMVGTGVGAANGVLIKGADILENINNVGVFIFDKTGTLTTGSMYAERFVTFDKITNLNNHLEIMNCVASIESLSNHPVANAIRDYCKSYISSNVSALVNERMPNVAITKSTIIVGKGIKSTCEINGLSHEVIIGNRAYIEIEVKLTSSEILFIDDNNDSFTTSYMCFDGRLYGKFHVVDKLKPDSPDCVQYLMKEGYEAYMITGDTHGSAMKVATEVGIPLDKVYSEVDPIGKSILVNEIRDRTGQKVAVIGDGINDSPALVSSDVGIAMGSGAEIAVEAAGIVIIDRFVDSVNPEPTLKRLVYAIDISKKTFHRIKLNLFWALCYNVFMVPIAMGALLPWGIKLPPVVAGSAMALSSLSVVMSSLRLRKWRPPTVGKMDDQLAFADGRWTFGLYKFWQAKNNVVDLDSEMELSARYEV